ncbi:MAG: fatty acid--CoA ligase family protein [Planctomycetota bacterium]|nr:fatty acid--CoA ligase family protein [Planctomycetota bacterium]
MPFIYESLARLDPGPTPLALRIAVSAGSPLAPRVSDDFTRRWHVQIGQLYGATELGTVSLELPASPDFDPHAIGRPLPHVSFRIVDVEDPARTLAPGQEGQLAVKAPSMLDGYLEDAMHLIDGHLLTGDLATLDASGRATITGRLKFLIDTGGFKVNPLEVESILLEHPLIAECAVVPMALSDTIHRPLAFIVPRDVRHAPTDAELRRFLRERLAPTKVPRSFELVASLPRSPMGKLLRDQLTKGRF